MAKPRIMFIDGGDPLTPNVESLAEKPVPQLDEEGKVSQLLISQCLSSSQTTDITK